MDKLLQQFRPIPFFFLNTTDKEDLSLASARKLMAKMKEAGYGGALLFNKPPTGFSNERYLSQDWYDALENFCIAAKENDLVIWINDGWDFPPGDAGGRIYKDAPELVQYHLEKMEDGTVRPVETPWGFPAFEEPLSSELFHKHVYEGLKKHLGKYFGDPLVGIFSDADNRRISAFSQKKIPTQVYFPWCRNLPQQFKERYGYEIMPHLQEILDMAECRAAADYWELVSDLYQKWFAANYQWCRENGLLYSFHTSDTGPLEPAGCRRSSVFSEGETLKLAGYCDYPGTDHELFALDGGTHYDQRYFTPEVSRGCGLEKWTPPAFADTMYDIRAKVVASAACIYGRSRTLCEAFAATNWEATPEKLRRIAAWQIIQGINFFVPHAVHVKLHDSTKFFAPPEFLNAFPISALRQFNDFLARYSMISAQGEYRPQIAVLDPTCNLWRGGTNGDFFKICDRLNRSAIDYVITDSRHASAFEHVIDPCSADNISLPEPYATFSGGELAYQRRFLPDGTSYFLAANIWSDTALSGVMSFDGRKVEIELAPGEIAVFGGPWEEFRSPAPKPLQVLEVTEKWNVTWSAPQRIGFTAPFTWENSVEMNGLSLLMPGNAAAEVDGVPLTDGQPVLIFGDKYTSYPLPASAGSHQAKFEKAEFHTPVYLSGDFQVRHTTEGDYSKLQYALYCLNIYAPAKETFVLAPRENTLDCGSWTDQGYPFYSGSVIYENEITVDFAPETLEINAEGTCCQVFFDGKPIGEKVFPPYNFTLPETTSGKHSLRIIIHNTLGNQLEQFSIPSGMMNAKLTTGN